MISSYFTYYLLISSPVKFMRFLINSIVTVLCICYMFQIQLLFVIIFFGPLVKKSLVNTIGAKFGEMEVDLKL